MDLLKAVSWRELEQVVLPEPERRTKDIQERANVVCADVGKSATPSNTLTISRQVRLKRTIVNSEDRDRDGNADNEKNFVMHFSAP